MKERTADALTLFALCSLGSLLILKHDAVSAAVIEASKTCVYVIIPSLFPMTVLSSAIAKSGVLSRFLRGSKLNPAVAAAFILGNVGGYPIGAKLLREACDSGEITPREASRAAGFCFGSGPAFAAGVAGAAVFGNVIFGIAAMAANILANLTLFIAYLITNKNVPTNNKAETKRPAFSGLMVESVSSATGAMMSICPMILFFAALKGLIEHLFPALMETKYLPAILEISNIAGLSGCKGISIAIISMLLGFGGICVHMQVLAMIGGRFSVKNFYLTRAAAILLSGLYAFLIEKALLYFGIACEASTKIRLSQSPSLIPIFCVAAMVFITLTERRKGHF